jgi:shikimate dehydrogenase
MLLRREGDQFVPLTFRPTFADLDHLPGDLHLIVSRHLRHSRTFTLYNRLFAARGAAATYLPYEITETRDLDALLAWAPGRVRSLLVSDPWKAVVAARLPLSEEARLTGAVNLVVYQEGRALGMNLDGPAAWEGLGTEVGIEGVDAACFFGCGGVSTAVALSAPVGIRRFLLVDRVAAAAEALAARVGGIAVVRPEEVDARGCGLIYNGTGLGKAGGDDAASPIGPEDRFDGGGLAWDANYTPAETAFLAQMRGRGWRTVNGRSHMLGSARHHLRAVYGWEVGWEELRAES